jgi:hypothetical protein
MNMWRGEMERMGRNSVNQLKDKSYKSQTLRRRRGASQMHRKHIQQNNSRTFPKSPEKHAHSHTGGL